MTLSGDKDSFNDWVKVRLKKDNWNKGKQIEENCDNYRIMGMRKSKKNYWDICDSRQVREEIFEKLKMRKKGVSKTKITKNYKTLIDFLLFLGFCFPRTRCWIDSLDRSVYISNMKPYNVYRLDTLQYRILQVGYITIIHYNIGYRLDTLQLYITM